MKIKLPRQQVEPYAQWMVNFISAHCHRIELAGSLRRRRPEVGDIEIVAIPKNSLYIALDNLIGAGLLRHADPRRWGLKLRSFILNTGNITDTVIDGHKYLNFNEGYQIDLALQPDPATWGVNFLLRTGSAEFSRKMVTPRGEGGFMPDHYRVEDARLKAGATVLDTPEEEDVFRLYGIDYVLPPQRTDWYQPRFGPVPDLAWEPAPAQFSLF